MPIYMDVHIIPGVKAKDVAEAHHKDMMHQGEYGCKCMTYWIDEKRDSVFCLVEASEKDAVKEMHSKAHGLVPNKIIEVSSSVVESFLGRIYDPEEASITADGLKVFSDPSFRVLLMTGIHDPVLLRHRLGTDEADEMISRLNAIVRKNIVQFEGSEVEQGGAGFIGSFTSAARAIACALAVQKDMQVSDTAILGLKMAINGGEPVEKSNLLFGDTILLARHLCAVTDPSRIALASGIMEIAPGELLQSNKGCFLALSPQEEFFLQTLFSKLEEKWQDPAFGVPGYCKAMAMSQSQLYRKTTSLTGLSFNSLVMDFRLEKARELLKKKHHSISQVTFDAGFSSPSYFTKCFKKKYGLLPMAYIDLL